MITVLSGILSRILSRCCHEVVTEHIKHPWSKVYCPCGSLLLSWSLCDLHQQQEEQGKRVPDGHGWSFGSWPWQKGPQIIWIGPYGQSQKIGRFSYKMTSNSDLFNKIFTMLFVEHGKASESSNYKTAGNCNALKGKSQCSRLTSSLPHEQSLSMADSSLTRLVTHAARSLYQT